MDTYTLLRHFADSWALAVMFFFFLFMLLWVFRPGASQVYDDTAEIPFRHENKPIIDEENQ